MGGKSFISLALILIGLVTTGDILAGEGPNPVIQKICAGTCSGKMAWVQAWNDGAGKVKVYQYQGDLSACSHPPQIFYEAGGKELGSLPEFPVNPQDPVAMGRLKGLQEKRAEWLKGLSAGEKSWCAPPT